MAFRLNEMGSVHINVDAICCLECPKRNVDGSSEPLVLQRGEHLCIGGWAGDPQAQNRVDHICAVIDESLHFFGSLGLPRPDVAAQFRSDYLAHSGFQVAIPALPLSLGAHSLRIGAAFGGLKYVWKDAGAFRVVRNPLPHPLEITHLVTTTDAHIDALHPEKAGDTALVTGWAIDTAANDYAAGVYVQVNRNLMIPALYGLRRSDVARQFGSKLEFCGFRAEIPAAKLPEDKHELHLHVFDAGGLACYDRTSATSQAACK